MEHDVAAVGHRLACECGFVAAGATVEEFVADAQLHARDAHEVHLSDDLVRALLHPQPPRR